LIHYSPFFKFSEEDGEYLQVTLQNWPKSINDLKLIRFWIRAFSNVCFDEIFLNALNPQFVSLLFPPGVNNEPIRFRCCNKMIISPYPSTIQAEFGPFICARQISIIYISKYQDMGKLVSLLCSTHTVPNLVEIDSIVFQVRYQFIITIFVLTALFSRLIKF
jgi:hypothetical protein